MNKTFYKYFVFLDELNSTIKQNIVKIRNIIDFILSLLKKFNGN